MINKISRKESRETRQKRVRATVKGTAARPRLCVFRSLNNISCQLIDDEAQVTLAQASTLDKEVKPLLAGKTKTEQAQIVGEVLAKRAISNNLKSVVFDRGGYLYIGRVKALADSARDAGLEF